MRIRSSILVLASCLLAAADLSAQEHEQKWSVSPYMGVYSPSLKELTQEEFVTPYEGNAFFINSTANNQSGDFVFDTPLPPYDPGGLMGLEFQWRINDRHSLILGAGSWQAISSVHSLNVLPVQGVLQSVSAERKSDISFTEYYLGWRYALRSKPGKYRLYLTTNLHQIFDVDYREEFTGVFLSGDVRSFRKSTIILAQATSLALLEEMVGGEWFINDWFSLGIEGGYGLGLNKIGLTSVSTKTDFLDTDNITLEYPIKADTNGSMVYKPAAGAEYKKLNLDFNGWKALVKVTVYY